MSLADLWGPVKWLTKRWPHFVIGVAVGFGATVAAMRESDRVKEFLAPSLGQKEEGVVGYNLHPPFWGGRCKDTYDYRFCSIRVATVEARNCTFASDPSGPLGTYTPMIAVGKSQTIEFDSDQWNLIVHAVDLGRTPPSCSIEWQKP